jgi:hydrogenase assembly chaperone HypC/HupF
LEGIVSFSVPGSILEEYTVRKHRLGLVAFGETHRPVFLDLVHDAHVGDYVRVHVGFATELISADEAKRDYDHLAATGHLTTIDVDLEAEERLPETARRQKH